MSDTAPKVPQNIPSKSIETPTTQSPTSKIPHTLLGKMTAWDIVQLQRTVGNKNLQRMLQQPLLTKKLSQPLIQRDFAVQIDVDVSDTINEIVLSGTRPKGALAQSKEGSHSTAWVVTVEGVKNAVMNKSIDDAVTAVNGLFTVAKSLPGTSRVNELLAYKQTEYNDALTNANTAKTNAQTKKDIHTLQTFIRAYLTYRNIIPLSAVDSGGNADGRSEAFVAALIREYASYDPGIIKGAMLALFDAPAIRQSSEDNQGGSVSDRSANTPGMKVNETAVNFQAQTMKQHLLSLQASYPLAFPYAFGNIDTSSTPILTQLFNQALGTKAKNVLTEANQVPLEVEEEAAEPVAEDAEEEVSYGTGKHTSSVQVTLANDNKISDVIFGSRPHGLFGSKHGSHTTAWGIFTEGVLTRTKGKTIAEAAAGVKTLSDTALALPGVSRANYLTAVRKQAFDSAKTDLEGHDAGTITEINELQNYIRDYLTFRNLVPLTTAMLGRAPGKGESEALIKLRTPATYDVTTLRMAIFKLMDSDAMLAIAKGSQKLPEKIKIENLMATDIQENLTNYAEKKGYFTSIERKKTRRDAAAKQKVSEGVAKARGEIILQVENFDRLIESPDNTAQRQFLVNQRNELIRLYLKDWFSAESDEATHARLPGTEGMGETKSEKFGNTTAESSDKSAQRLTEVIKQHMMTIKVSFPTAYTKAAIDPDTIKTYLIPFVPFAFSDEGKILSGLLQKVTNNEDMLKQCLPA